MTACLGIPLGHHNQQVGKGCARDSGDIAEGCTQRGAWVVGGRMHEWDFLKKSNTPHTDDVGKIEIMYIYIYIYIHMYIFVSFIYI